jgi:hypothetical protein
MIAQSTPLEIIDFRIKKVQFQYVSSNSGEDFEDYNTYPVDLDFDFIQGVGKNFFSLDVYISSNIEKNILEPGYSFSLNASAEFYYNEDKINKPSKSFSIFQSGLEIAIGQIRGYLANVSAFSPVGVYHLPSLDLIKLFERKFEQLQKTHPQMKIIKNKL